MTVILLFIVCVIAVALWWLLRQGLMSKPWLETGPSPAMPMGPGHSTGRVGLGVFLTVIGGLFALFGSAFVMRMEVEAWSSMTLPPVVWLNTLLLIGASLLQRAAAAAARRGDLPGLRRAATLAALATAGFLLGQLFAWRALTLGGEGLTTSSGASFFYMLSGLHGLHILGGLTALGLVATRSRGVLDRLTPGLCLCATYWDFLLIVWVGLLVLFLGWANQFADICRALLS